MLAGVRVRVGVNAVRLAYPAPSGVVNYRLRAAGPVNQLRLGAGLRDFGTRVVQGDAKWSDSAEARVGRQFEAGGLSHLVTVSLRGGHTTVDLTSNLVIPLGTFNLRDVDPPDGVELPWSGTRGQDTVEQVTASAGYGVAWSDRVQLRFAVHRTRYEKDVLSIAGARTEGVSETTLYNLSAVASLTDRTAVFGSWLTGLEEAGVAPTSSINRDEVLPPVEAEQFELGVRHAITPSVTFIGAVFDVSKHTNGFRADASYGLVGEVRHRGVEGSISGQLDARTSVVLGAMAFEPEVTGPLVDAGVVGARAAGISHVIVNANVERRLGDRWSVDAGLSYFGERWADTANTFKTPAVTTLNLGARSRFVLLADRPSFVWLPRI